MFPSVVAGIYKLGGFAGRCQRVCRRPYFLFSCFDVAITAEEETELT